MRRISKQQNQRVSFVQRKIIHDDIGKGINKELSMTRLNNYKKEIRITDRLCRDHSCISYDDIKTLSN